MLNLQRLLIDEDSVPYLKNFRLPKLKRLDLDENCLQTEGGKQFINKVNMPLLEELYISNILSKIGLNFFNSSFLAHLREEGYVFKALTCKIVNMDIEAFS